MDNNLVFRTDRAWTTSGNKGKDSLTLSYFRGACSLTVFSRGANSPLARVTITPEYASVLSRKAKEILTATPGTRITAEKSTWDPNTKTLTVMESVIFVREDTGGISMEITAPGLSEPLKFPIRTPMTISINGSPMTDSERSEVKIDALIKVLAQDILLRVISTYGMEKRQFPGNSNGSSKPQNNANQTDWGNDDFNL